MKSHERERRRIQRELARVNRAIAILKKEPRPEELEGFGDNTPLSEELDATVATEARELRTDRLGHLFDRAAALDEALHRFEQGDYGTCVSCGTKIAPKRLEAVPEAMRCAPCQADFERSLPHQEPLPSEWRAVEETYEERERLERGPREREGTPESPVR